jgi:signal transduction histidine kinase
VLSLVSALHGPEIMSWVPRGSFVVATGVIFFSCFIGTMIAHLSVSREQAHRAAHRFARANIDLELLVDERTQNLLEKVAELEQARAEAVEANAAKSRFIATMSHELRTPLNAILGFSELIQTEMFGPAGDARYVDYAQHIHQSGSHLLSLIGDILDLSKIEAGKMELYCEALAMSEVLDHARQLAGQRDSCVHDIQIAVEPDLPLLEADRRMTVQMVLNLLSNAMKFTPPGGTIVASAGRMADGGICIRVRDTGVGIAKEDIPKALAAYSQVRNVQVREHKGTGLGLPIVSAMMELHGGMLQLESEVGVGTVVSLFYPPERTVRTVDVAA